MHATLIAALLLLAAGTGAAVPGAAGPALAAAPPAAGPTGPSAPSPDPALPAAPPATTPPAELAPVLAPAPEPRAAEPARRADRGLELDLLAGARFPQLFSRLGVAADGLLRFGWRGPLDGRLELLAEVGNGQPSRTFSRADPRLTAGRYDATLTVRDLSLGAGAAWRFQPVGGVAPYAGLALQLHLVKALTTGSAGAPFGENTETGTLFGAAAFGGVRWRLGPGVLLGELRVGTVPVDQLLTGASDLGAATLLVGYGVAF